MKNVSDKFKKLARKVKQQNARLSIDAGEKMVKEIHVMPVHVFNALPVMLLKARRQVIAKEIVYSFDGKPFKTIMQQIDITVKNAKEIKDKNIIFEYGIFVDNQFEYVNMGHFFIKDVEDSKGKNEIVATGYDNMIKFMKKKFNQAELKLTYPCKVAKLVQKIGEICEVELHSTDFFNSDLYVDEDFFTAQEVTYRDVLDKITQTTLTIALIKEDKLMFKKFENNPVDTFDSSILSDIVISEKFGPVNSLVLGRGDVEDNIEEKDQNSINENRKM